MTPLLIVARLLKLVWTFVPFILTVIFDDRPFRQVLRENLSYTVLFVMFLLTACGLVVTTYVLNNLRTHHTNLATQYRTLELTHDEQTRQLLRLRETHDCPIPLENDDYDPYRALKLLDF